MATGESWVINGIKNLLYSNFHGTSAMEEFELLFFSNNYTPLSSCINSDLTEIEANGLEKVQLVNSSFGTSAVTVGTSTIVYVPYKLEEGLEFNITGTQTMYGYAIRGKTTNNIYYVKNVGLHSFISGDTYTMNPIEIRLDLG